MMIVGSSTVGPAIVGLGPVSSRTLADMRTEVYERADVREGQIPKGTVNKLLNASLKRLYRLLVSVNKDYNLESTTVSIMSGLDSYALPDRFWRVRGVDIADGSNWVSLPRFSFSNRNRYTDLSPAISSQFLFYRVMGGNIKFVPEPSSSSTVKVWYIPLPVILEADDDEALCYAGFEDYAIIDTVIKIKDKLEEDVQPFLVERRELETDIRNSASERDDAEPDRIRDVDGEAYWPYAYLY